MFPLKNFLNFVIKGAALLNRGIGHLLFKSFIAHLPVPYNIRLCFFFKSQFFHLSFFLYTLLFVHKPGIVCTLSCFVLFLCRNFNTSSSFFERCFCCFATAVFFSSQAYIELNERHSPDFTASPFPIKGNHI